MQKVWHDKYCIQENYSWYNTTPIFQEVGGVIQPLKFCRWHKEFPWYRVNQHKIDWFLFSRYFYFFVRHCFQLKWTRTSTHSETHSVYGKVLRVIFLLFWFTKFLLVSIQHRAFLNYCRLYIFKKCAFWHAMFRRKNRRIMLLSKRFWYCCSDI